MAGESSEAGEQRIRFPVAGRAARARASGGIGNLSFGRYYRREFRHDLTAVISKGWKCPTSITDPPGLQPRSVSTENPVIVAMSEGRQNEFALALYLTLLTDRVMCSEFREDYPEFRALTCYPVWKADCPGGCDYRLEPEHVLYVVGAKPGSPPERIPAERLIALEAARPEFHREIQRFVRDQMPWLGRRFWQACSERMPRMRDMELATSRGDNAD